MFHRKPKGKETPHIPFYKDERVLGQTVTVSVSIRVFILAVVFVVLAFGYGLFRVLEDDTALHNYVAQAHAARIADQKATQAEINQLACYIIANIPDKEAPIVPKVRKQYGCPPYGKDPNFRLYRPSVNTRSKSGQPSSTSSGAPSAQRGKANQTRPAPGQRTVAAGVPIGGSTPVRGGGGGGSTHRGGAPGSGGSGGSGGSNPSTPPSSSSPAPSPSPVLPLPVHLPPVATVGPIGVGGTCAVTVGKTCLVG